MFLALQFPFADLREFLGPECGRLSGPKISSPEDLGKDFIRSSGLIRRRRKGGVKEWAGEELFASGQFALRFPNHLGNTVLGNGAIKGHVINTFRRFYLTGPVARFEVALKISAECSDDLEPAAGDWLALLHDALALPMHEWAPPSMVPKTVKLISAGKVLAQHYLAATTRRKPPVKLESWWFCAGTPALVVEFPSSNPISLPPHAQHVLNVPDAQAEISHAWLEFENKPCSAWFVGIGQGDPDAVRRLRINLTRLHAERECLNLVLANVGTGLKGRLNLEKDLVQLDEIQQYLKNSLVSIQKPERFGMNQASMFEAAHDAFGIALAGQEATLSQLRQDIAVTVDKYIRRAEDKGKVITNINYGGVMTTIQMGNVQVGGDFTVVTAKNIENSFNKAAASDVSNELKENLKLLAIEVAKLAKELPAKEAERVTNDLSALTSEAVSGEPRKEWYQLSAKGILDAAKFVAEMVPPVTKAVTGVLAALALVGV